MSAGHDNLTIRVPLLGYEIIRLLGFERYQNFVITHNLAIYYLSMTKIKSILILMQLFRNISSIHAINGFKRNLIRLVFPELLRILY